MSQPGFMIYADDWSNYIDDYSDVEIGEMFIALLEYFMKGEFKEFEDRGMRQFFRQATKAIDLDRTRYEDRCLHNAHNKYRGDFRKKNPGKEPLDFDDWYKEIYLKKDSTVNDRQRPSTDSTNTSLNSQSSILNSQLSILNSQSKDDGTKAAVDRRRAEGIEAITGGGLKPLNAKDAEYWRSGQYG